MAVSSFVNGHKFKSKYLNHGRFASQSLRRWWATRQRPNCQIPRCKSVRKFLFVDLWFKSISESISECVSLWKYLTFRGLRILASNAKTLYFWWKRWPLCLSLQMPKVILLEMIWNYVIPMVTIQPMKNIHMEIMLIRRN